MVYPQRICAAHNLAALCVVGSQIGVHRYIPLTCVFPLCLTTAAPNFVSRTSAFPRCGDERMRADTTSTDGPYGRFRHSDGVRGNHQLGASTKVVGLKLSVDI